MRKARSQQIHESDMRVPIRGRERNAEYLGIWAICLYPLFNFVNFF